MRLEESCFMNSLNNIFKKYGRREQGLKENERSAIKTIFENDKTFLALYLKDKSASLNGEYDENSDLFYISFYTSLPGEK